MCIQLSMKVKVKQSLYKTGQALSIAESWGTQIARQSAHEGGKFVRPMHCPPVPPPPPPENILGTQCDQKDYVNEKFDCHYRESKPRPSGSQYNASTNCATVCPC